MTGSLDEPTHDYVEAFYGLRAPRVAIVFPGDTDNWHFFAKSALWQAGQLWGGAGFVLVPHHAGLVNTKILRAVAAYDPDYVVGANFSWKELLTAYPQARSTFVDEDGNKVDFEGLALNTSDEIARDLLTQQARDAVAAVCQVYRRRDPDSMPNNPSEAPVKATPRGVAEPRWDVGWANADESNMFLQDPARLTPISAFSIPDAPCLAAPADLQGPWGVWVATIAGVAARPTLPGVGSGAPNDAAEMAGWFYGRLQERPYGQVSPPSSLTHSPGDITLSLDSSTLPSAWARTTRGLVAVRRGYGPERLALVTGDSADDFALALIYDRMWGNALWIPSVWSPLAQDDLGLRARAATTQLWQRITRLSNSVLTSVSGDQFELDRVRALIERNGASLEISAETGEGMVFGERLGRRTAPSRLLAKYNRGTLEATASPNFPRAGVTRLAVKEEFSIRTTVPVLRSDEEVVVTTTPPAMQPTDPDLIGVDLNWHVDVRLVDEAMPLGRGLDGHVLVASADQEYETWVRSGADGVSYENKRYDFVSSGANTEQRLARPRIRFLAIHEWARTKAAQAGYDTAWSDAGRRAWLLQRMIGGRTRLIDEVAGKFSDVAAAFNREGRTTDDAYPDHIGVKLTGSIGYLMFQGMRDILIPPAAGQQEPAADLQRRDQQARELLDKLLQAGLLRRGLILGCATCETPDFVAIDDLGKTNDCRRCGARTDLTLSAWRYPPDEPSWFYDLHPVARKFFEDHGNAPLWLASYLAATAREYADCAELNLLQPGTRKSVAEVDLLANVDGVLITAEVKTSNTLGNKTQRNDAAKKRIRWAAVLHADEIVLATTTPEWEKVSVDTMRQHLVDAIKDGVFPPGRPPSLRLIAGLHTPDVKDAYVDLWPKAPPASKVGKSEVAVES